METQTQIRRGKFSSSMDYPGWKDEDKALAFHLTSFFRDESLFKDKDGRTSLFFIKQTIGTTISVFVADTSLASSMDDYEIVHFNDDYDLNAKPPVGKKIRVKGKVRYVRKHQPKAFFDSDALD